MPTTFANTIDENELLAKRSQCDYAGNDIQTTYATKNELPTATSDLMNDSDFITSSDIPVKDVQVGGTSVVNAQGIAEISIPQTGVLDVEVDGSSVVNAQGVAEITLPTFTQVNADWEATSGVAQILNKPAIPTATSDLTNDSDFITLSDVPAQVNADWNSSSGASEILNKPDLSVYATTSAMNTALADKQDTLTAGTNVQIANNVISATDTKYTAGTGIEISNNEISVETPVDIVAGPGIVVDNPDGNTLRVSVAQDIETVLFESANGVQNNITLSENIENFEFVRVEWCPYTEASNWTTPYDIVITKVNVGLLHLCGYGMSDDTTYQIQTNLLLACSTTSVTVSKCSTITTSPTESKTSALTGYKIFKIVGIHRIQGGN